jgi:dienelactone hydrolase
MKRCWIFALVLGIAAFSGNARADETIEVPSVAYSGLPNARPAPGPLLGTLYRPAGGGGPWPAVIVLHTCAGIGNGRLVGEWALRLNRWGYAAFVLDSFTPRHVENVCSTADAGKVTPLDRAVDTIEAARVLAKIPAIDANHIGVVGMSNGGATAVQSTLRAFSRDAPNPIKAAVSLYGTCRNPAAHGNVPLLALAGDADDWGDPAKYCSNFKQALGPDQPMELKIYSGVYHSFDNDRFMQLQYYQGHPQKYDADAAKDAFETTHAFLDKYLKSAP